MWVGGVIIVGLASVIVGTSILPARTILQATFACIVGAVLYRFAVALSLNAGFLGLQASDVQLVTAVLVTIALIVQRAGACSDQVDGESISFDTVGNDFVVCSGQSLDTLNFNQWRPETPNLGPRSN